MTLAARVVVKEPVMSATEPALMSDRNPEKRKRHTKLAEALREHGCDEGKVGEMLCVLVEQLSEQQESGAAGIAAAKLLLEVVKEIVRVLEPQKAAARRDPKDTRPYVRLIHNVPRPVRKL